MVELLYCPMRTGGDRETGRKVEITVVKGTVPSDVDLVTAHQRGESLRVKRVFQDSHVLCFFPLEHLKESSERHVRQRNQSRETDVVMFC